MTDRRVPTNGHQTRTAAIIELYEAGVQQKLIARQLGCSTNAVSQAIFNYRQKTGRIIPPVFEAPPAPHIEPDVIGSPFYFCMKSYRKSVRGAREALEAMRV